MGRQGQVSSAGGQLPGALLGSEAPFVLGMVYKAGTREASDTSHPQESASHTCSPYHSTPARMEFFEKLSGLCRRHGLLRVILMGQNPNLLRRPETSLFLAHSPETVDESRFLHRDIEAQADQQDLLITWEE